MAPTLFKHKAQALQHSSNEALQSTAKTSEHDQTSAPESSAQSTNITPTGFKHLPFDCLYLIFGNIPLQSLLPLRRQCRTWNDAIVYICTHKKRLTLVPYSPPAPLGKNEFDLFWMDDLGRYVMDRTEKAHETVQFPINQLNKRCTIGLAQLFPSLTELRIHYDCHKLLQSYLTKLGAILQHFSSPTLTLLSFTLSANQEKSYSNCEFLNGLGRLISSNITVGRFPNLKQFDVCIAGNFIGIPYYSCYTTIDIEFQAKWYDNILFQLEHLSLGYNSRDYCTRDALNELGPSLVSLGLDIKDFDADFSYFEKVKFQSSLTHLRLNIIHQCNRNFIRDICDRFQELKFIQIRHDRSRGFESHWIEPLSTLEHLSEMRLHNFYLSRNENPLPRIKKLTLCKRSFNVSDEFCRVLTTQFPNLDELVLVCRPFVGVVHEDTKAREAMQLVRQHFAHLRTSVVCDFTAQEWSE